MADQYPPKFFWRDPGDKKEDRDIVLEPGAKNKDGTNTWLKLKLNFSQPKEYDHDWGKSFLYSFDIEGTTVSWWAFEEEHDFLKTLGMRKGSEILMRSEYYQWKDKKGNMRTDVYGIVDFKGKEYEFGKKGEKKESKPDQPDVERQPTKKELLPKTDQMVALRDLYEECLHEVLDMLKTTYDDPDKPKPNEQFSGSEVVRMINTLFMAKAKVI